MAIKLGSTTWRGGWCGYQREAFQAPSFFKGNKYLTVFNANGVKRLDARNVNYNDNGYAIFFRRGWTNNRRPYQERIYHDVGISSQVNPVNGRYLPINGESHYSSHSARMVQIGDDVSTRRRVDDSNWVGRHPIFVLGYSLRGNELEIMTDTPNCEFVLEVTPRCSEFYTFRNNTYITTNGPGYGMKIYFVESDHRGYINVRLSPSNIHYLTFGELAHPLFRDGYGSGVIEPNFYFRLKSNTNAFGIQYTPWYYSAHTHDMGQHLETLKDNYPSSGSVLFMHAAYKDGGHFRMHARMRLGEMGCKMVAEVYSHKKANGPVKTYTHNERRVNYHSYQGNLAYLNFNVDTNNDDYVLVYMDEEGTPNNKMRYKVAYAIY